MIQASTFRPGASRQRGLTLIEMMVVLVIGLVLSLAIFMVLAASEGRKRTTTSLNDIGQAGNYSMYILDKMVRSAGSGFGQSGAYAFGCQLFAAKGGAQIIPAGALPAPFTAVNTGTAGVFRLAPLLIAPGQTTPNVSGQSSDVLVVMGGTAGFGENPVIFHGLPTVSSLDLPNTVGFQASDLVLVAEDGNANCMIEQVNTVTAPNSVTLSGTYYSGSIGTANLTGYTIDATVMNFGNVAAGKAPSVSLVGVGNNNTLFSYNLLQTDLDAGGNPVPLALADSVFELHALYGVDPTGSGTLTWVSPAAAGYDLATLMNGSAASAAALQSIKAVRLGLITRTSLREKAPAAGDQPVAPASIVLFADLADGGGASLAYTRNLTTTERNFRYRAIESTIPLRNNL